jgi:hypothetical protein
MAEKTDTHLDRAARPITPMPLLAMPLSMKKTTPNKSQGFHFFLPGNVIL